MGPTSFDGQQMLHGLQANQRTMHDMHALVAAWDRCDLEGEHAKIIHVFCRDLTLNFCQWPRREMHSLQNQGCQP